MFVVHGRQTAEPMHFELVERTSTHSITFAVNGTSVIPTHHHYFLSFNSARAVNSIGTFLVILCAVTASSFY